MQNIIIIVVLIGIVGYACYYIWKEKKKGRRCIGCPYSGCEACHCKKHTEDASNIT